MLIYKTAELFLKLESRKVSENISKTKTKKTIRHKNNIFYGLAKYIKMAKHKRDKMEKDLDRINVEMTPEQYVSEYLLKGLIGLILGIIFLILKRYLFAGLTIFITLQIFLKEKNKLQGTLFNRRRKVEKEAPFFIRFINTSLKSKGDIIGAFEKYSEIAKYLKTDIEKCLVEMKSSSTEGNSIVVALENLEERVNTPIMTDFITGLVKVSNGQDQSTYFEFLEKDVLKLSMQNMTIESNKIKAKVRKKLLVLIYSMMAMLVVFFAIAIKSRFIF